MRLSQYIRTTAIIVSYNQIPTVLSVAHQTCCTHCLVFSWLLDLGYWFLGATKVTHKWDGTHWCYDNSYSPTSYPSNSKYKDECVTNRTKLRQIVEEYDNVSITGEKVNKSKRKSYPDIKCMVGYPHKMRSVKNNYSIIYVLQRSKRKYFFCCQTKEL